MNDKLCSMSAIEFSEWLRGELEARQMTQAELVRRSKLSSAHISKLINMQTPPGVEACNAIARAFNMPPESVLRIAGLIDPEPSAEEQPLSLGEWIALFIMSSAEERERLLTQARALVEYERQRKEKNNSAAD